MFYSQFILAKKGPLGTIWIAAHLERKLRKNQVADTDIGVSVDSILFPEMPIALRLSSHLLLGVVRIYNKKVNYLFDDCSETLLKIKQAFRSTAVDLPPEESKAPYHSITLPETFDLDDFELPDSDNAQGNYVDHHVSSRDQITLQDNMEGISYSTSKFGLDERFGDGDASGLDLEEDLLLENIGTSGRVEESADPQASFGSRSPVKQEEHPEDTDANLETMAGDDDEDADLMDYAQAPRTPGLVEEPNLSNVQDASACDEHMESEYHLMESTAREHPNITPYGDKQELDWCSRDGMLSNAVPHGPLAVNECLSGRMEIKEPTPQGEFPVEANVEDSTDLLGQVEAMKPASEFSDIQGQGDLRTEAVNKDKNYVLSVEQVPEGVKAISPGVEVPGHVKDGINQPKSFDDGSELPSVNEVGFFLETLEAQACEGIIDSRESKLVEKEAANETLVLRPCSSILEEQPDMRKLDCSMSTVADVQSEGAALAIDGKGWTLNLGEMNCETGNLKQNLMETQVWGHASGEDILASATAAFSQVHATESQKRLVEDLNVSTESELPAPEKLLSVPEGLTDLHRDVLVEVSPWHTEADAGSKSVAGKKRSFTESTLTEQSLYSVESSRHVHFKLTTGSVPDDNDLLSSILAGRRSSVLKVKSTPPPSELTSTKRGRSATRSGAPKRKVLMDDSMVLHGDKIRQQLTNTEDIRRVRKKAPCTLPEISMIRKQHMEDEIFLGTTFTGISVELASLHSQVYDLSRINVCQNDPFDASLKTAAELGPPSQNDENSVPSGTIVEPNLASHDSEHVASRETVGGFPLTSTNETGPDKVNLTEESGQVVDNNEIAQASESQQLSKEDEGPGVEVDVSQEPIKPTNDVGPEQEFSVNVGEVESFDFNRLATNNPDDASAGLAQTASLNKSIQADFNLNMDGFGDSPKFDFADIDPEQIIAKDNNTDMNESETERGASDSILPNGELDYNVHSDALYTTTDKHQEVEFSYASPMGVLEDGYMNNGENTDFLEAHRPDMMDAGFSGFELQDQDELNYLAAANDTDFLNVDDDDLSEAADDYMPDPEETQYTENTGWSSRTRAVSKYLQSAFVKEADRGRISLSMTSLLNGKSRKEASRMFFETLVLKTRDYVHVEQENPFDDISIKPRTRLMKANF